MREILQHFDEVPLATVPNGATLLAEGEWSGRVYALAGGPLEYFAATHKSRCSTSLARLSGRCQFCWMCPTPPRRASGGEGSCGI